MSADHIHDFYKTEIKQINYTVCSVQDLWEQMLQRKAIERHCVYSPEQEWYKENFTETKGLGTIY